MAAIPIGDFILAHGENYQQCPYNLAHVVTNARLIVHLDKCRRNYIKMMKESGKRPDMKQCKFNYVHHVPAPEIDFHETRCPDQYQVIDSVRYHESDEFKDTLLEEQGRKMERDQLTEAHHSSGHKEKKHSKRHKDVKPQVEKNPWGEEAEDWEAESNGYECGYDPAGKLESEIVLFHPRGLSKSERKTFRHDQRIRAADHANRGMKVEEVDVKPFAKLDVKESKEGPSTSRLLPTTTNTTRQPPPVKPEPVDLVEEIEEGECSEEEFFGEDPYS